MRRGLLVLFTLTVLAVLNGLVIHKEFIRRRGTRRYLRLAPVDPPSLIQGDFMRLRYEIAGEVGRRIGHALPPSGHLVVGLDERGVTRFIRIHRGEPLGPGEHLLRYRDRGGVWLGAEAFFFQEGESGLYAGARYGEPRVGRSGESVLVGLAGEHLEPLGRGR